MTFGRFSTYIPVEVVESGGILVRQVDTTGAALDDTTDIYSVALPVMPVDETGANEDSSRVFSTWRRVTISELGFPVVRVDVNGDAVDESLGSFSINVGSIFPITDAGNTTVTEVVAGETYEVEKTGGVANTWDASAISDNPITGDAAVLIHRTSGQIAAGLTRSSTPDSSDNYDFVGVKVIMSAANFAVYNGGNLVSSHAAADYGLVWYHEDTDTYRIYSGASEPELELIETLGPFGLGNVHRFDSSLYSSLAAFEAKFFAVSNTIPVNTVVPSITGNPMVGSSIAADSGTWMGTTATYSYQWYSNDTEDYTTPTLLTDQTSPVYVPDTEAVYLFCVVTADNGIGNPVSVNSEISGPVVAASGSNPENTIAPVLSGVSTEAETVTVTDNGSWSNSPTSYMVGLYYSDDTDFETGTTLFASGSSGVIPTAAVGKYVAGLVVACNANGCGYAWSNVLGPIVEAGDTTAPNLSLQSGIATGQTTADLSVTTDEGNGTLYWVITETETTPTPFQIKDGEDHLGVAAVTSGSKTVSASGEQTDSASGLTDSTGYYAHFMHEDASTNQSGPVTSALFETSAMPATNATRTTADGVAPEVDINFVGAFAGYFLHIQRVDSIVASATDVAYDTPDMDILHMVTASEVAGAEVTNSALEAEGYTDPAGAYSQRYRWERDDGAAGAWSHITDTIVNSVAKLTTTAGNSLNDAQLNATDFTVVASGHSGAPAWVRSTHAAGTGLRYFEAEVGGSALPAGSNFIFIGLDAGTTNINHPNYPIIGSPADNATYPGLSFRVKVSQIEIYKDGAFVTTVNWGENFNFGHKIGVLIDVDTGAETNEVTLIRALDSGGVDGTVLWQGNVTALDATFYALLGMATTGQGWSINFGASAFSYTPAGSTYFA